MKRSATYKQVFRVLQFSIIAEKGFLVMGRRIPSSPSPPWERGFHALLPSAVSLWCELEPSHSCTCNSRGPLNERHLL